MAIQPSGMSAEFGVILSIGMFANGEPFELVQPMVSETTTLKPAVLCQDAVESFIDGALPDLLAALSMNTNVVFVSAEGMQNGRVPWRDGFNLGDKVGTSAGPAAPTHTAALGLYYADPDDLTAGQTMKSGKSFFAGIDSSNIVENGINTTIATAISTYMDTCQGGYPSLADSGSNWWRVVNVPTPRSGPGNIIRSIDTIVRTNLYTQKRRFVPR